jgi:pilus assembly protein CpaE
MPISLLVASSDEHFRETVRDSLVNIPNARVISEYPEVSSNLYIRVLQDLERNPQAALIVDLAGDPDGSLKAVEKVKQAAPDIYVIVSNHHADGETVIASLRAGSNDFLIQPVKRVEFREAMARLERTPRRAAAGESKLGKIYTFLGAKGGVGTTTLAVNLATLLGQQNQQTVLVDLDFTANDCAMQLGDSPQHSLEEVGANLSRMDQALFEGLVIRDPLGFSLIGPPPDAVEHPPDFSEPMFREFANFLVENYSSIVIDAGRWIASEVVLAALQSSNAVFLTVTQQYPSIRNAQRYIAALMRLGFTQDQLKIVVNQYQKKAGVNFATLEQIQQTLNQPVFATIPMSLAVMAAVNRGRPIVADRTAAVDMERALRGFLDKVTGAKSSAAKTA